MTENKNLLSQDTLETIYERLLFLFPEEKELIKTSTLSEIYYLINHFK